MVWTVYECGTPCLVGANGDVPATITGFTIHFQNLIYEVTWWDGSTKKTEWINPGEITFEAKPTQQINNVGVNEAI